MTHRAHTVGDVQVHSWGTGLAVRGPRGWCLVDAPPGVTARLDALGALEGLTTVVISSDRFRACGGLLEVFEAVGRVPGRESPIELIHPLNTQRVPLLVGTWSQGWPDSVPVCVDGRDPGMVLDDVDPIVHFVPLRAVEPERTDGPLVPVETVGVRLDVAGVSVAWLPSAAPCTSARRMCSGASLALVEVAARPWPDAEHPMRLNLSRAVHAGSGAEVLWLVGDDGRWVSQEGPAN